MAKRQSSIRISETGDRIWDALARKLRLNKTGVIERSLDMLARSEGIDPDAMTDPPPKRKSPRKPKPR